jgi:Ca2+-binding EF-hand superfamily protein|eukprot:CAMPEP_0113935206 /NCGR_PEP_ID=MMETSP1339-20121228/2398_1 /TAXON_ID=94617 /ORGANISM="Fibrocapsa japonica" /LENGTH=378 /DNA_ID=CAMNT_0000937273 /DNA_START=125 /DNA_END=1261 /DNA_ORIENTATION=- /assembly_acc=CAM_ASM_000762
MGAGASAGASVSAEFNRSRALAKRIFNDKATLKKLWTVLDFNGNGMVSLAEIDKMIILFNEANAYEGFFKGMNNKPALMRAYKRTIEGEGDGDAYVQRHEFTILLRNLYLYNQFWAVFDGIDGDDRRVDINEFKAGVAKMGYNLTDEEAEATFAKIDKNGGGQILFDEFCDYCMKAAGLGTNRIAVNFDEPEKIDPEELDIEECREMVKQMLGKDKREVLMSIWNVLDFNGNGKVSLAEIDRMVVMFQDMDCYDNFFKGMNNKPALMRAYKATITGEQSDGDDWVSKREFPILLRNLYMFNRLWRIFDEIDTGDDRRIDLNEFKAGMAKLGNFLEEENAATEFAKIDTNGGGQVLFDEFCAYLVEILECKDDQIADMS